ncbi:beta-carotene ketolase (CrtW type) [Mucilaginibacter gossypiicola]|uniref:Beta-carotene ketolase (CrtW type) n=1 Tax=Mucilaginibacter gossypiicola TaxID=551995 RepID=A0A1H8TR63_9SPHI|nr:fatty acid desaturase [Mucilaginibacter gossypiicola]SEO93355.1 beta-carotene ketolase (CrtW type) [Mucilaginibacter gossypiicola]
MQKSTSHTGLLVASLVIGSWAASIILLMQWHFSFTNPLVYIFMLVQMHLYTGLFITAHDAMHGTVSPNKSLNNVVGYLSTFLYASFWYPQLYTKHHKHHSHVHTHDDPDYYHGGFFAWYVQFIRNYLSIWQIVVMAAVFNILKIWIPQPNLIMFWVVPSLLSTLQLFYFGTYQPHKGEHNNPHFARSQRRNHFAAFFCCYFFGYHYEHHESPGVPWWRLWKAPLPEKQKLTNS